MDDSSCPRILTIYGPTAVGKTSVAIEIAVRIDGEIVSCDSRQVFKYLDIGTAKPTTAEREQVRFHLIDVIHPTRLMNAYEFRLLAEKAIDDILARGKVPIMTVGTGFYLKAMTDGIFEAPSADDEFRLRMEEIIESDGTVALHARLKEIDPEAASAISENDAVRIIRALELYYLTGKTRSELAKETQLSPSPYKFVFMGLTLDREELYEKIDRRCEQMLDDGLMEEAKSLREKKLLSDEMAEKIVGYNEVYKHLDGIYSFDETLAKFQQATRNYAKRQLTWFRKHPGGWICDVSDNMLTDKILQEFQDGRFISRGR